MTKVDDSKIAMVKTLHRANSRTSESILIKRANLTARNVRVLMVLKYFRIANILQSQLLNQVKTESPLSL